MEGLNVNKSLQELELFKNNFSNYMEKVIRRAGGKNKKPDRLGIYERVRI